MYTGRLIFSQLMDHLPMPTFRRCVERYQGDRWVKGDVPISVEIRGAGIAG